MIEWIISKGEFDPNKILFDACRTDEIWLIELMIEKGANDWSRALSIAIENDCQESVYLILDQIKNNQDTEATIDGKTMRHAAHGK